MLSIAARWKVDDDWLARASRAWCRRRVDPWIQPMQVTSGSLNTTDTGDPADTCDADRSNRRSRNWSFGIWRSQLIFSFYSHSWWMMYASCQWRLMKVCFFLFSNLCCIIYAPRLSLSITVLAPFDNMAWILSEQVNQKLLQLLGCKMQFGCAWRQVIYPWCCYSYEMCLTTLSFDKYCSAPSLVAHIITLPSWGNWLYEWIGKFLLWLVPVSWIVSVYKNEMLVPLFYSFLFPVSWISLDKIKMLATCGLHNMDACIPHFLFN